MQHFLGEHLKDLENLSVYQNSDLLKEKSLLFQCHVLKKYFDTGILYIFSLFAHDTSGQIYIL